MVHAHCKREWWGLKETAETFFFEKSRYEYLMSRCYHNYHLIWTKYFLLTEVTTVHTHCYREWWELKETGETFFFILKSRYEYLMLRCYHN